MALCIRKPSLPSATKVNPHFLYNTLNNKWSYNAGQKEAANICEILGEMFRYNLREDRYVKRRGTQYIKISRYEIQNRMYTPSLVTTRIGMRV